MVNSIDLEIELKDEFSGKLGLEKIKKIVKLDAEVEKKTEKSFSINCSTPLIIGYKAMSFPDTILADEVSASDIDMTPISAEDFYTIKSK